MSRRRLSAFAFSAACCALFAQAPVEPKPVQTFKGHADPVYAVAYSPDGKAVATGSFDKTIKLWDAASGKELRTLAGPKGHQSLVLSIAFSPAGDLLASGGADNFAKLWDLPAGKPLREHPVGGTAVRVAVSTDGKTGAAGGSDGKIKLFATADGKPLAEIPSGSAVRDLAFIPNSPTLVALGADRILRYWNATDGKPIGSSGTGPAEANGLVVVGGNVVTTSTDGTLRAWPNTATPDKPVATLPTAAKLAAITGDGNLLAVAAADKTVKIVNLGNGQITANIPAAADTIADLAWNGDNATLAVAAGAKVLLWGSDGKPRGEIATNGKALQAVAFSANRTELLTAGDDGKLKLWKLPVDPNKPAEPKAVDADAAGVRFAALLPNGQAVAVGTGKTVKAWDVNAGKEIRSFGTLPARPTALAVSRDGALLAVAAGKAVKIWQTGDGKELPFPALAADAASLAFTPDRQALLVGTADKSATAYSLAMGQALQFFPTATKPVLAVYHPNQQSVFTVEDRAIVKSSVVPVRVANDPEWVRGNPTAIPNTNSIFAPGTGKALPRRNVGNLQKEGGLELAGPAAAIAVSRNGQLLAAAGADNSIQIYTLNNGQLAGSVKATTKVRDLAFHPNQQSLAASLDDKTVTVWNTQFAPGQPLPEDFGRVIQSFPHPALVASFVYLGDKELLTGGDDGIARVWKVMADEPRSIQHPNLVDCVAVNADGGKLATACHDGVVRIYDLTKPNPPLLKDIKAHVAMPQPHPVYVVAWSPDGKLLASGSYDRSIKLWDPASGNLVREIKGFPEPPPATGQPVPPGHRDQVFCLAFSKDGRQLVSGSSDRTIKLWDVASGNLVRDFPNPNLKSPGPGQPVPSHDGFVHAVRFSTDGQSIISAGTAPRNAGMIGVWSANDGKLLARANVPFGPIYSIDLSADGIHVLLGCGPRIRTASESEAFVVRLPGK